MPAAIRWREKVLLIKTEVTYGVDPTPTGAANAILATNCELRPMEGEDVSRNLERPYLGAQETVPVSLHSVLTFSTELAGSGVAGTAPAWGPIARACAMAQVIAAGVSVTYSRISTGMESASIYFWIGPTKYVMLGARGTGALTADAQGVPVIRWTLTSLFTMPVDAAPAVPTLTAFQAPLVVTKTNTTFSINAVPLVMRSFSLDLGNDVQRRFLVGKEEILIVDTNERINCVVEATPLATINPFSLAAARTKVPVVLVHGTVAGNIATVTAPTAQLQRPSAFQENQGAAEWPLALSALPNAGNDQFTIALT